MGHGFCMTLRRFGKRISGFSLIDVMIVVVIIGILVALAFPNLDKYLKRARQTEAKINLSAIYTAQKIYYTIHQEYTDQITQLDITLDEDAIYGYTFEELSKTAFKSQASANIDDDDALDIWTIDQDKNLDHVNDDVTVD